jgi:hypothetical protein
MDEVSHSWKVPKQASKPSCAEVVHQSPSNPILSSANAIPLRGARAVLIGANDVPRRHTPLTHPPLTRANRFLEGAPPVHRAIFSRFPLPRALLLFILLSSLALAWRFRHGCHLLPQMPLPWPHQMEMPVANEMPCLLLIGACHCFMYCVCHQAKTCRGCRKREGGVIQFKELVWCLG